MSWDDTTWVAYVRDQIGLSRRSISSVLDEAGITHDFLLVPATKNGRSIGKMAALAKVLGISLEALVVMRTGPAPPRCKDCRFFDRARSLCRRRGPPWFRVDGEVDWCGEFALPEPAGQAAIEAKR